MSHSAHIFKGALRYIKAGLKPNEPYLYIQLHFEDNSSHVRADANNIKFVTDSTNEIHRCRGSGSVGEGMPVLRVGLLVRRCLRREIVFLGPIQFGGLGRFQSRALQHSLGVRVVAQGRFFHFDHREDGRLLKKYNINNTVRQKSRIFFENLLYKT